ncbi:unnamed protein product [Mycena citricolor]|uniref:Uncharacterized protein n=1 Tax=Mycena citricolor TaxID=2018698 RepID=A0AAD2JWX0_9AGAR|nr:unnamed protein product [Mycena citricolor]
MTSTLAGPFPRENTQARASSARTRMMTIATTTRTRAGVGIPARYAWIQCIRVSPRRCSRCTSTNSEDDDDDATACLSR